MNPLLLWIPGVMLILVGTLLLAIGRVDLREALTVIGIGLGLETIGTLIWLRQRGTRAR